MEKNVPAATVALTDRYPFRLMVDLGFLGVILIAFFFGLPALVRWLVTTEALRLHASAPSILANYGFIIGFGLVFGIIGLLLISLAGASLRTLAALEQGLRAIAVQMGPPPEEAFRDSAQEIKYSIDELKTEVDSMHLLLGGRYWKRDALDRDFDGPTIQELLRSIDGHLEALAPEPSKAAGLVRLVR